MMAVVANRPKLRPIAADIARIRALAESCAKQLTAWRGSIEAGPVQGKRHLSPEMKERRAVTDKAAEFRLKFLRGLKPQHPLHDTPEARAARGEAVG